MLRTETTTRQKAFALLIAAIVLTLLVGVGLLLRENAPGNMGNGFLVGAGVAFVVVLIMGWRVTRADSGATVFERAFTSHGDERDAAILTRALAVLGLMALPLAGVAGVTIGLGANPLMVLVLLMVAESVTGIIAFAVYARRH